MTIYNPAGKVVNLQDDSENTRVEMTTAMMTMEIPQEQQDMQISQAGREVVDVSVRDGDVLVLIPDPADDSGKVIMAFKVVDMAATSVPEPANDKAATDAERPRPSSVDTTMGIPPDFDRAYTNRKMTTGPSMP